MATPDPDPEAHADEGVGSIAEEAAKLMSALRDRAEAEHRPSAEEQCPCPLCRVLTVVRGTSPEVRRHLTSAATSLVHAAAAALATPVPREDDR